MRAEERLILLIPSPDYDNKFNQALISYCTETLNELRMLFYDISGSSAESTMTRLHLFWHFRVECEMLHLQKLNF